MGSGAIQTQAWSRGAHIRMASGERKLGLFLLNDVLVCQHEQSKDVYGGSFTYHLNEGDTPLVAVGFVVSLKIKKLWSMRKNSLLHNCRFVVVATTAHNTVL